jgi:hypothetical protein
MIIAKIHDHSRQTAALYRYGDCIDPNATIQDLVQQLEADRLTNPDYKSVMTDLHLEVCEEDKEYLDGVWETVVIEIKYMRNAEVR